MSDNDTPRTNEFVDEQIQGENEWAIVAERISGHARTLERELAAAIRERDELLQTRNYCMSILRDAGHDDAAPLEAMVRRSIAHADRMEGERDAALARVAELETERDALRRQLTELEEDKARLDWLENFGFNKINHAPPGWFITYRGGITLDATLRSAIDSARTASGDAWIAAQQDASVRATSNPFDPNCQRK